MTNRDEKIVESLAIVESLIDYDGPVFHVATNPMGQRVLGLLIDSSESSGHDWLYVEASTDRIEKVRTGQISVREAYEQPETGQLIRLRVAPNGRHTVTLYSPDDVPQDILPTPGHNLDFKPNRLPTKSLSVHQASERRGSTVLDIGLKNIESEYELPARKLASLLQRVQSVLEALALDQEKEWRKVPHEVRDEASIYLTEVFQSSYGLRFEIGKQTDIAGNVAAPALERLVNVLDVGDNADMLIQRFRELNLLSRHRLVRFFETLGSEGLSFHVDWAHAGSAPRGAGMSLQRVRQSLGYLVGSAEMTRRKSTLYGQLFGITWPTDFKFKDSSTNETIRGKIASELAEQHYSIPCMAEIEVIEEVETNEVTGDERWHTTLIGITQMSDSSSSES